MIQMPHVLAAFVAALALPAIAQLPSPTQPSSAQPVAPPGGQPGFFRPQADPALTPARPDLSQPSQLPDEMAENVEKAEVRKLQRIRRDEEQMDRAEVEAAKAQEQIKQYLPNQPVVTAPGS